MKYELTDRTLEVNGVVLHQIRAREYNRKYKIKKHTYGGFIEKLDNLSQEGNCWVAERAIVMGDASATENTLLYGDCRVSGKAEVFGEAMIGGNTEVKGSAQISGKAKIHNKVCRYSDVMANGDIVEAIRDSGINVNYRHIVIEDHAIVRDEADLTGNIRLRDYCIVGYKTKLYGNVTISRTRTYGDRLVMRANVFKADICRASEPHMRKLSIISAPDTTRTRVVINRAAVKKIATAHAAG